MKETKPTPERHQSLPSALSEVRQMLRTQPARSYMSFIISVIIFVMVFMFGLTFSPGFEPTLAYLVTFSASKLRFN